MCLADAQPPRGGSKHSRGTVCLVLFTRRLVVFTLCLVVFTLRLVVFTLCLVVFKARVKIRGPRSACLGLCLVFVCV